MKIKLDENIPYRLVGILADMGHDVDTVQDEGLAGHSDASVWENACQQERFLIIKTSIFRISDGLRPALITGCCS